MARLAPERQLPAPGRWAPVWPPGHPRRARSSAESKGPQKARRDLMTRGRVRVAVSEPRAMRTYGNWRKPMSAGLGALGSIGTAALLLGLIVVIFTMMFVGLLAAFAVGSGFALGLLTLMVRNRHGRKLLQGIALRIGWTRVRATGSHLYRSGPLGRTAVGQVPAARPGGRLALSEYTDSYGARSRCSCRRPVTTPS